MKSVNEDGLKHQEQQVVEQQETSGGAPPGPRRRPLVVLVLLVAIAAATSFAFWRSRKPAAETAAGMADMEMSGPSTPAPSGAEMTPDTIFIAPQRQQLIGIQTAPVTRRPLVKEIRTVGKVAYDETKITHIHTKFTGYIEEVFVDFVGQAVKRGEPLFTIYSPELVATQAEYLLALKSQDLLKRSEFPWVASGSDNLLEAARRRLQLWDISDQQIEELEKTGKVKRALTIYSPVNGIVTERAAYHHGRYVSPDMDLYTLADISTVWVQAEIYEYELPFLRVGQMAKIEFPYTSGNKALRGRVQFIDPFLDPKTRTAQVRMEFSNPKFELRPEMFFNVKLGINLGQRLVVPVDAVLNTGTQQYVFVDKGDGDFEPRLVEVSAETVDYYAIEKGLKQDEEVVTAANFILDSESRLRGAFANMGRPSDAQGAEAAAKQAVQVEVLEPKQGKVGKNAVRLLVKDASGKPIENAEVSVRLFMPQMGSMPPMATTGTLQPQGNGIYAGEVEVLMAWTWETTVTVRKDGKTIGTAMTNIVAR